MFSGIILENIIFRICFYIFFFWNLFPIKCFWILFFKIYFLLIYVLGMSVQMRFWFLNFIFIMKKNLFLILFLKIYILILECKPILSTCNGKCYSHSQYFQIFWQNYPCSFCGFFTIHKKKFILYYLFMKI